MREAWLGDPHSDRRRHQTHSRLVCQYPMSRPANGIGRLQAIGSAIFAPLDGNRLRLTPAMQGRLAARPLNIIDVGAAFGPDRRWLRLGEAACRFMAFEPDPRSSNLELDASGRTATIPIALGSTLGTQVLHLTKAPFASSFYR